MKIKNTCGMIGVFVISILVASSIFASANTLESTDEIIKDSSMAPTSLNWIEQTYFGQDWDIDADGPANPPAGDVEDFGEHSIRMGYAPFGPDATAWYMFDIGEDIVDEGGLQVGIYFCDWAIIPGFSGPDLSVYNWAENSWTTWENIGGQDNYIWVWKAPLNSNKYVLNGLVWVRIYAEALDDTVLDTVGVKYIPGPDLECEGSLGWVKVAPGSTVTGNLYVKNVGYVGTTLNWCIAEWPEWGTWTFNPSSGELTPGDGAFTVQVSVVAPNEKEQTFTGELKVINEDCDSDYEIISISLSTPQNQPHSQSSSQPFQRVLQRLPNAFPILRYLLGLQ